MLHELEHQYFESDKLFSIGEISEICGISAKMLRYYDKIALVKPSYTDDETGYRFYSKKEILLLTLIKELKCFGLELQEIKTILDKRDLSTINSFYEKMDSFVEEEIRRLHHVKNRIAHQKKITAEILSGHTNSQYEFSIKEMEEMTVLYMGIEIRLTDENIQLLINEAQKGSMQFHLQIREPYFIVIPDKNVEKAAEGELVYIEACVRTSDDADSSLPYIKRFPKNLYASGKYSGSFDRIRFSDTNAAMAQWIKSQGYRTVGPRMVFFLNHIQFALLKNEIKLEMLIPITK